MPAPPLLPAPRPVPEVWAGSFAPAPVSEAERSVVSGAESPSAPDCPAPDWASVEPGSTPGAGAAGLPLPPGVRPASARHAASSATSIV